MAVEVIKITKTELERRNEAFSSMAMLVAGLNASNRALKQREILTHFSRKNGTEKDLFLSNHP